MPEEDHVADDDEIKRMVQEIVNNEDAYPPFIQQVEEIFTMDEDYHYNFKKTLFMDKSLISVIYFLFKVGLRFKLSI